MATDISGAGTAAAVEDRESSVERPQESERPPTARRRLVGLDAFRGAVLAVMVLTPVTGDGGSYPHLGHAPWNGFTVADAILPLLLVASGTSLAFLLRPPVGTDRILRLVRRTVALVVIGVIYNAWGQPWDLGSVRLTGVLQLIGVAGALAAVILLALRRLTPSVVPVLVAACVMAAVHGLLLAQASPDCLVAAASCSPTFGIDVGLFGQAHLHAGGDAGFDPEGVMPTVASSSLVLVGVGAGERLRRSADRRRAVLVVLIGGAALVAVALGLDLVQPINKRLATPAFVALGSGLGLLGIAACTGALDLDLPARLPTAARRTLDVVRRSIANPAVTLGRNALVVFLAERLILVGLDQTSVTTADGAVRAQDWLLGTLPVAGVRVHLAHTAVVMAVVLAITWAMRGLRWRIAL